LAIFPFFGTFLTGLPAAGLTLATCVLFFWIGLGCYRLQPWAWWALAIAVCVFGLSGVLTFSQADMIELYEKMGYPQAQINLLRQYNWMDGPTMMSISLLWLFPVYGYLFWIKRYFPKIGSAV
jgi:hypothetical protein